MKLIHDTIIAPALSVFLPAKMNTPEASAMLLTIGMQESRLKYRRQHLEGPARGLWQFERGGVAGVLRHHATQAIAKDVCWHLGNAGTTASVYHGLESDDALACCFARLLLWTLPGPLPGKDEPEKGWTQYLDAWRPGKPHVDTWAGFYAQAWEVVE